MTALMHQADPKCFQKSSYTWKSMQEDKLLVSKEKTTHRSQIDIYFSLSSGSKMLKLFCKES